MARRTKLIAPKGMKYIFTPSERQYELWKALQPECDLCGGEVIKVLRGTDPRGNELFDFQCSCCKTKDIPQIVLGGGAAGGGKSYLGCNWIIQCCLRWKDFRACIARKTLKTLKETTMVTFWKIIKDMGLEEDINYTYNDVLGIIKFWNGSEILLKELTPSPQDPTWSRLGGLEVGAVFCDECDELEERSVDVLFSRIRWMTWETTKVPKMLLSCNPNLTWVRKRFVIDEDGKDVVTKQGEKYIPFSLYDNPDPSFRHTYEASLRRMPKEERMRLLYGDWRYVSASDVVCYPGFDNVKHLRDNLWRDKYDPDRPLILSWDFNTYPYISTLAIQINYDKREIYFLKELLGYPKDKQANTPAHSRAINKFLLKVDHTGPVIITGDPAGKQKTTATEDGVDNFSIIKNNIKGYTLETRLFDKSPSQAKRVEFINEIFEKEYDNWKIFIDSTCFKLVEDLVYQKKNPDGTKDKSKSYNSKDNIKFEKYGHLNDCLELFITKFIPESWTKFCRTNERAENAIATAVIEQQWDF